MSTNSQTSKASLSCGQSYQVQWGALMDLRCHLHFQGQRRRRQSRTAPQDAHTIQVRILRISLTRRLHMSHAAYPPPSAPPNVPMRSFGDARERGLAAWFNMSAVSTPVLQRILEGQLERADDWLPVHLRGRMAPPPPPRLLGVTSVPP